MDSDNEMELDDANIPVAEEIINGDTDVPAYEAPSYTTIIAPFEASRVWNPCAPPPPPPRTVPYRTLPYRPL